MAHGYMACGHVSVRSARLRPGLPKVRAVCAAARLSPLSYGELNIIPYDRFTSAGKTAFFILKIKGGPHNEKSKEELQKEHDEAVIKREQYQHQCQRLESHIRYYAESERKKRNHRLITRGAAVEGLALEVKGLSERVFSLPEVAALVRRTIDQQEGNWLALFHFHITQIKRSAGQSVVMSAAYWAREKLCSEYYGEVSYTHKGGVVCSDILLPPQAPAEYRDRTTLWNTVEKAMCGKKAQLALG